MTNKALDLSTITEHVLVVDDNEAMLKLISQQLALFGIQPDQAINGKKAVELLQSNSYGLIITDMVMPEMDGMELLIYAQKHCPETDVLVVSAYNELYNFTDLVAAGAIDFITKPYRQDELRAKLQRIFRERLLLAKIAKNIEKERSFFLHIVESLAISLEEKDTYTHGHSRRVTNLSLQLAEHTADKTVDLDLLRLSGILHDIGKIGIPDKILGKNGKLTEEEFSIIKRHPELGEKILHPMKSDKRIAEISKIIRHHHERYDGKGYPDGLSGQESPYLSRIITIADSYDAMTSDRPYRKGMAIGPALEEIKKCSGSQFDPILVELFVDMMEEFINSAPCTSLATCSIFPSITNNAIYTAYELQYCRSNYKACARHKISDKTKRPENLLPDGSYI